MLVNVNMVDKERADKNVELRKKKPDYLPYAEDESVDDLAQVCLWGRSWGRWCVVLRKLQFHGFPRVALGPSHPLVLQQKPRSILAKYDEELEGERPHSFRLEQGGMADGLRERELEEIRAKLRLQAQSLSSVGPRLASEYLSPEEMVSLSFVLGQFYLLWSHAANVSLGKKLSVAITLGSWVISEWQPTEELVMNRDH